MVEVCCSLIFGVFVKIIGKVLVRLSFGLKNGIGKCDRLFFIFRV